jgi:hypothetical protein
MEKNKKLPTTAKLHQVRSTNDEANVARNLYSRAITY